MNPSKWLFLILMLMGTMISISANSWPTTWMGLEINLMGFIPLILSKKNILSSEAAMKYFLIQAMASSMFLMFIIIFFLTSTFHIYLYDNFNQLLILSTLMIKMGAAPFHFWFPTVMEGLSWNNCFILMTWQKIAPMVIMSYLSINIFFLLIIIMFSILIGSLGGLNQTSIRKIMTYSSINHIGWIIMSMIHSQNLWLIYFLIYSIISMNIIFFLKNSSIHHFNQLTLKMNQSPTMKILILINFLSLGGLPPFLGFLPKWFLIQAMMNYNFLMSIFMVILTLITLFFYLRLIISTLLINEINMKWIHSDNMMLNVKLIISSMVISLTGLTTLPFIFL